MDYSDWGWYPYQGMEWFHDGPQPSAYEWRDDGAYRIPTGVFPNRQGYNPFGVIDFNQPEGQ